MIEINRGDFFDAAEGKSKGWTAIVLVLCREPLGQTGLNDQEIDQAIDSGRTILASMEAGFFTRSAWMSYFAMMENSETGVLENIRERLASLLGSAGPSLEWKYAVKAISDNAARTFGEIEVAVNKAAGA